MSPVLVLVLVVVAGGGGGISSPVHGIHPKLSGFHFLRYESHFFSVLSDPLVLIGKAFEYI